MKRLREVPAGWDLDHDGRWGGYVPDVWFRFDDAGFDLRPDGSRSGWRAFAYAPFPGTFFPTNGSADDVLVRLDPILRQAADGRPDDAVYAVNLAIVESLIKRADVVLPRRRTNGLSGSISISTARSGRLRASPSTAATAAGSTRMRYVGRKRGDERELPIAPGLFPVGTEFLHSVRYLDVTPDVAGVVMAPRMKGAALREEVRWLGYAALRGHAAAETVAQNDARDGTIQIFRRVRARSCARERSGVDLSGVHRRRQRSAPSADVRRECALRWVPRRHRRHDRRQLLLRAKARRRVVERRQERDRRLVSLVEAQAPWAPGAAPAGRDVRVHALPGRERRRRRAARENAEVRERFFDARGALRPDAVARLHTDVATLLLPSASRAVALDRAYMATVEEQSFTKGRDAIVAPAVNAYAHPPVGKRTGIQVAIDGR